MPFCHPEHYCRRLPRKCMQILPSGKPRNRLRHQARVVSNILRRWWQREIRVVRTFPTSCSPRRVTPRDPGDLEVKWRSWLQNPGLVRPIPTEFCATSPSNFKPPIFPPLDRSSAGLPQGWPRRAQAEPSERPAPPPLDIPSPLPEGDGRRAAAAAPKSAALWRRRRRCCPALGACAGDILNGASDGGLGPKCGGSPFRILA